MRITALKSFTILLIFAWVFSGWPQFGNFPPHIDDVHAAAGDVDIGRWTDTTTTLLPTTSWAAPNGLFTSQGRNDNSTYTFTDSTASVDIGTVDADGYLIVVSFEFEDTSNGRHNPQGKIVQTSGTGTFVSAFTSGYNRDNSEDRAFVRTWAFVDGPSAGADFQFQWKRDSDTPTGGTVTSSFDVIPLYYADLGIYSSTSAALYGGTTPNVVTGFTGTDGTNITISSDVVTVTGDNKRYLILGSWFLEGSGGRTQRIGGFDIDGSQLLSAQSYAYIRNTSNDENGAMMTHLLETATANQTIEMTLYRGDGITANLGGADSDGSTSTVGQHALVVIELNDSAEVFHSTDGTGNVDLNVTGPIDVSATRAVDINIEDTASFTRASDTAMNATVAMDALVGANLWAAQEVVSITSRWTARAHFTVDGVEDADTKHGNYARNNQGTIDTFGWSANLLSFVALAQDEDIGVSIQELSGGEDGGTYEINADTAGFWGINLDTLYEAAGNSLPVASGVSIDSGASAVTLTENTTHNVACVGTVTDADGFADITTVTADFYRTSVGIGGGTDDNNYYQDVGDSECVPSGGSGTTETYTCTFPVQYFADPTDVGSPSSSDDWTCNMTPSDAVGAGTASPDTIEMNSLLALDVTSSINYSSVDADTDTGATNQITTVTNTGNRDMDPQLSGTDMSSGGDTLAVAQQKYSATAFTYSSGGTALSSTPTTVDITLPQRTSTEITDDVLWGLGVPGGTVPGTYTGTNTFTAAAGI